MSAAREPLPDLILEQYALGELSAFERAEVESALAADPALRARLQELHDSNEAILRETRPSDVAASIRRRMLAAAGPLKGERPAADRFGARPLPLSKILFPAAAAILVLAGALMTRDFFFPSADDLTRPKGGQPNISVYKKAVTGAVELSDGSPAAAGDVLQIKYSAGESRYGAIYSLDGRGTITRHLPAAESGSALLAPRLAEAGASLGSAYELDDAPGYERFFIVSSPKDFDLALVSDALRDLAASGAAAASAAPRLPAGIEWKSLLIVKKGDAK